MNPHVYIHLQGIMQAAVRNSKIVASQVSAIAGLSLILAYPTQAATINSVSAKIEPANNTVQFSFNSFGAVEFKRAYIDADQSLDTGFCGGYEFLIENGEIYDYTGQDGACDWSWAELCQTFTIGDREDRTLWNINVANLNNISVGAPINFELEYNENGRPSQRTSLETTLQLGEVSRLEPRVCEPATAPPDNEITKAAVRVDSSSHTVEIDFESTGFYESKLVLIDTDNNPQTGHWSFLSEEDQGYDLLIDNGFVRVFAGNNGSDDFKWEQISTADQNVGQSNTVDNIFWSVNTCEVERFLPPLAASGAVMFVLQIEHDNLSTSHTTFETSFRSIDLGPGSNCPGASNSTRKLADETAQNLYRTLGSEQSNVYFFPDDTIATGPNDFGFDDGSSAVAVTGAAPSGSGGGVFIFLLPILGFLCALRCKGNGAIPHTFRKVIVLIALGIMPVGISHAQELTNPGEQFLIQYTEPLSGKFWIDVGGASSAGERELMEALLSSALVKVNNSIWNNLDNGLPIRVQRCDGQSNAYYNAEQQEIVLCWELYESAKQAYAALNIAGDTPEDFARGFLIFVLYHELAHALADLRELPNVGNSESNADGLATVFSVEQGYSPFAFIAGLLFLATGETTFGTIHPGGASRAGDIICWVTGGDQQVSDLPAYEPYKERFDSIGRDCVAEYQANRQLIVDVFPDFVD